MNFEKSLNKCRCKNNVNRTNREESINVLKTFINDFLNDVVISLLNNEVERMLKFNTYSSSKKKRFLKYSRLIVRFFV